MVINNYISPSSLPISSNPPLFLLYHSYSVFNHAFLNIARSLFISFIASSTYVARFSLIGLLVVPWMTPSEIIHDIHCFRRRSEWLIEDDVNGLTK